MTIIGTTMEVYPSTASASSGPTKRRRKGHQILAVVKSAGRKRFVPWGSALALLITWIGLYLFSQRLYTGMVDLEEQSKDVFKFLIPYLQTVRQATVITAIIMVALTAMMAVVGLCATMHCDHCYRGRLACCMCGKVGSRIMCGLFWFLSYLLNLGWMFILSFMVVMTSAYFAFLPVCLPQSGTVDAYCLNFTILSNMMMGSSDANSVNLLLCGGAIDKLCKLTKAILPWYWGAYLGCLVVILGLSHFNGSLAANFAHGKHATRYVKIRDRTSSTIEWSKNWRVKSVICYDLETDSAVALRKRPVKIRDYPSYTNGPTKTGSHLVQNGDCPRESHYHRQRPGSTTAHRHESTTAHRRESTTASETEFERDPADVDEFEGDLPPSKIIRSSNSSIVLSLQSNGDIRKPLALPPPSDRPFISPPAPPYRPRPSYTQSETRLETPSPIMTNQRSPSSISTSTPVVAVNSVKEARV